MKPKLVFATNNLHKLSEVREMVKDKINLLSLNDIGCNEDIAETGKTLEENALIKVRHIKQKYGYDSFGDDTGLEVETLGGAPGVYSARYAGEAHDAKANMAKLLDNLKGDGNRHAQFKTVVALILGDEEYLFEGKIVGTILEEKKGDTGFGYDPVFQPNGYNESFAQLGLDVKNKISHRALAVKALCDFLSDRF